MSPTRRGPCLLLVNSPEFRTAPIKLGGCQKEYHQRVGEMWREYDLVLPSLGYASSSMEGSLYLSTLPFMRGRYSPGHSKLPSINTWAEAHSAACQEEGERRWLDITPVLFVCVGICLCGGNLFPQEPSNEGTSRSDVTEQSFCSNP